MAFSKIDVSKEGTRLLTQREPWDNRKQLVDQLYAWFGNALVETKQRHHELFTQLVPSEATNGKITRGDNYKGYPYVLLDYPNAFSKENILAARNLIWLGNGFHCTLHIRGMRVGQVVNAVSSIPPSRCENIFICRSDNEWLHHVNEEWLRLDSAHASLLKQFQKNSWIKVGSVIDIHQPDTWNEQLANIYDNWAFLLSQR